MASPSATATAALRGEYVGTLTFYLVCPLITVGNETFELLLPPGYRARGGEGDLRLLDRDRNVVARYGDRLRINGKVVEGGSFCMVGRQLEASRIAEVAPSSD